MQLWLRLWEHQSVYQPLAAAIVFRNMWKMDVTHSEPGCCMNVCVCAGKPYPISHTFTHTRRSHHAKPWSSLIGHRGNGFSTEGLWERRGNWFQGLMKRQQKPNQQENTEMGKRKVKENWTFSLPHLKKNNKNNMLFLVFVKYFCQSAAAWSNLITVAQVCPFRKWFLVDRNSERRDAWQHGEKIWIFIKPPDLFLPQLHVCVAEGHRVSANVTKASFPAA